MVTGSILYITNSLQNKPKGGREMLNKLNYNTLCTLYGSRVLLIELNNYKTNRLSKYINALVGNIDGVNISSIKNVLNIIDNSDVRTIFLDGSNLGGAIHYLRKASKKIEIVTYFHNVEFRFFWDSFIRSRTFRAFAILISNYLAERKAVKLSDKIIALSTRDSNLIYRIYGRNASYVSPIAIEDNISYDLNYPISKYQPYALFVGGNFYANRFGIKWFVDNVVPKIKIRICVIGKGMKQLSSDLEIHDRVSVIGEVDNISDWYRGALFVIAPIFDGSGMKTKVAEALMHGKKVIGTTEAFVGYEETANQAYFTCDTADEFIIAINSAASEPNLCFDLSVRRIFDDNYSVRAATIRLKKILST